MYAVVQTGGKQYRVAVGQSIQVEKLPKDAGESIELDRVLFVDDGGQVTAGTPLVEGARVVASVSRQERGSKILVFRYKSKKRVRVLRGHRQSLTRLFIRDIIVNGESAAERSRPAVTAAAEPASPAESLLPGSPVSEGVTPSGVSAPLTETPVNAELTEETEA